MEEYSPPPTEKTGIQPKDVITWGLVIVGGIVVYRLLRGTGLLKSVTEQKIEDRKDQLEQQVSESELNDWTKPNFYKQNPPAGYKVVTYTDTSIPARWVINMRDTDIVGPFNDVEKMKGLINQIQYKTQFSYLAYAFFLLTQTDLMAWLKDKFSAEDLQAPIDYLNKLPTYKKI